MKRIYEKVPLRQEKVDNSMLLGFVIVLLLMLMIIAITLIHDFNNSAEAASYNLVIEETQTYPVQTVEITKAVEEALPLFDNKNELTVHGQTEFITFLTDFYNTYSLAINQQNASFLTPFVSVHNLEKFNTQFDEWFVHYKEIQTATVSTEIGSVTFRNSNIVEVEILETVHLTHQQQNYRVNLMWTTFVMEEDMQFKIADRVLTQSLVSYEQDGKWIKY